MTSNNYERIFEFIRKEEVILFVGAGFSMQAGLPSANKLGQYICDDLYDFDSSDINKLRESSLSTIVDSYIDYRGGSKNELIKILQKHCDKQEVKSLNHEYIGQIPHFKYIVSTNYDTLFEQHISKSELNVVIDNKDCNNKDDKKRTLYKIHGDINAPESIVISSEDYEQIKNTKSLIFNNITTDLSNKKVLFIGFSFEDEDVKSIFDYLFEQSGSFNHERYLIAPNLNETQQAVLKEYGIRYFNDTAEEFFPQLIRKINDSILFDFKANRTSSDTTNTFVNKKGLALKTEEVDKQREITSIRTTDGRKWKGEMIIKTKQNIPEKIKTIFSNDNKINIGKDFYSGWGVTIPIDDIDEACVTIEDLTVNSTEHGDLGAIHIVPVPKEKGYATIVSSHQTYDEIPYVLYGTGESVIAVIKTKSYILSFDVKPNGKECGILYKKIEFERTYENYYSTKKHLSMLCDITKGGLFTVITNHGLNVQCEIGAHQELHEVAVKAVQHCEYVHDIETLTGVKFKNYESYNEQRLQIATCVWHYLNKECMIALLSESQSEIKHPLDVSPSRELLNQQTPLGLPHEEPKTVALNGRDFNLPQNIVILPSVMIKDFEESDEWACIAVFEPKTNYYLIAYIDEEEFYIDNINSLIETRIKEAMDTIHSNAEKQI